MQLSVIVILFNMRREAMRTLFTLSAAYQRNIEISDYEVIVIDNGSSEPLDPTIIAGFGDNFRYRYYETSSVSPVDAINLGAKMARAEVLAVIVDGARMVSPCLLANSAAMMKISRNPFICALSWHLGDDIQPRSMQRGYNQAEEDRLLSSINWKRDGYLLFDIATIAPSSLNGFLGPFPIECSWFCMPRQSFFDIGGFNPAFQSPGGGLCNHEFRNRAITPDNVTPVMLIGEGLFHQFHGGVATNAPREKRPHKLFFEEYRAIIGESYQSVDVQKTVYFGAIPEAARRFILCERTHGERD